MPSLLPQIASKTNITRKPPKALAQLGNYTIKNATSLCPTFCQKTIIDQIRTSKTRLEMVHHWLGKLISSPCVACLSVRKFSCGCLPVRLYSCEDVYLFGCLEKYNIVSGPSCSLMNTYATERFGDFIHLDTSNYPACPFMFSASCASLMALPQ